MSLIIDLPRPIQERLEAEASKVGVSTTEYAAEVLTKNLPTSGINAQEQQRLNAPSVALLESWLQRAEVAATPEQTAEAEADLAEFMRNMNAPRQETEERLHFPDVASE